MSKTHPAGPVGIPGIGPITALSKDPLEFLEQTAQTYGDVSSFREGPFRRVFLLNHPDHIEDLLMRHAKEVIKDRVTRKLRQMIGNGLVISEGEHWKRQRKLAAPSFTPHQIAHYGDQMVRRTADAVELWEHGEVRDTQRDIMGITLDIVLDTLFGEAGTHSISETVGDAIEIVMTEFDNDVHSWRLLLPGWVPTAGRSRIRAAVESLDGVIHDLIAAGRARTEPTGDLLARLLAARDEDDGQGMTDVELRDEVLTLLVAGHETTSIALFNALLLIGQHEDARNRLQEEINDVLGNRMATVDDLHDLPYTHAVANESMRVYPPVWIMGREVVTPFEIDGVAFQAGDQILVSPWLTHHDERWFDDPSEFRPERWLTDKERPRFAFYPFGGGPRGCIGNHFAMMEFVLVLATLVQRVKLTPVEPGRPSLTPSITLRPTSHTHMRVELLDATLFRD